MAEPDSSTARAHLGYINALRGAAILLIVAAHTNSFAPHDGNVAEAIYRAVVREGTALFVLISGFLFQHLHARYTARTFWWAKTRFVLMPYLVMSVPALVMQLSVLHTSGRLAVMPDGGPALQAGFLLVTGGSLLPLWFIPVILMIFACFPVLRWLADSPWLRAAGLASLASLLITVRPEHNLDPLTAFAHFLPVYVVGMWLYRDWHLWAHRLAGTMPLCGVAALIVAVTALSKVYSDPYADSSISVVAKILFFMWICAASATERREAAPPPRAVGVFHYLASLSFAIYFLHGYVAGVIAHSPLATAVADGRLAVALGIANALLVTGLSIAVAESIRRVVPRWSRMLIGA